MINKILKKYQNNEKNPEISNYTLDSITLLLDHLGNPHKDFKSIHVAGTNGKGSTAFMISSILQQSGYKTGLYTSPHLIRVNERIKINSIEISDSRLSDYLEKIDFIVSNNKNISPTFFDILTAIAFLHFKDESVDIAIVETGLGGRLDSTNIIIPELVIITDISLDHVNILGHTIQEITKEKCGIIKSEIPVITSNTKPEQIKIIKEYSSFHKSKLYLYNENFFADNITRNNEIFTFDYNSEDYSLPAIKLPLFPIHQILNSIMAITAIINLQASGFYKIKDSIIYKVLSDIKIPGRFQKLFDDPIIIFDPAHNYDALKNLLEGLNIFYKDKKILLVISMMKDKADKKTIDLFKKSHVIYYLLNDERAYIPDNKFFKLIISNNDLIFDIINENRNNNFMILFTGTFRIFKHALSVVDNLKEIQ